MRDMGNLELLGISSPGAYAEQSQRIEHVIVLRPLHRVLHFSRQSIDDVINSPISKNLVLGYFKLYKEVHRTCEAVDLERQWNPTGAWQLPQS